MAEVIPFEGWHVEAMDLAPADRESRVHILDLAAAYNEAAQAGPAFSLVDNGEVIAAAGIRILWPGVAQGWMVISIHAGQHSVVLARKVRRILGRLMAENGVRRLEAEVLAGFGQGIRLAEFLGFRLESVMPSYGINGETYFKYVRF